MWAEVQSDIINSDTGSNTNTITNTIHLQDNTIYRSVNSESGTATVASKTYTVYYQTDTNLIKYCTTTTTFEDLEEVISFPILLSVGDGTNYYGSIFQVFNGMGYIGSTVWIDKGVKGLIPNGRNEDGSLRNDEYTTDKIITRALAYGSINGVADYYITLKLTGSNRIGFAIINGTEYNNEENVIVDTISGSKEKWLICGTCIGDANNAITSFKPKLSFRAVDYNDALLKTDKSEIISWTVPDFAREIAVANTANGFVYTTPTAGYLKINRSTGDGGVSASLYKGTSASGTLIAGNVNNTYVFHNVGAYNTGVSFVMVLAGANEQYYFSSSNVSKIKLSFVPCKGV